MPSTIFLMTQSDDMINYTFLHFTLCPLGLFSLCFNHQIKLQFRVNKSVCLFYTVTFAAVCD